MGRSALIAVDCQLDYGPDGPMATGGPGFTDQVLDKLAYAGSLVDVVIATRDLHPPSHFSFKENGGRWPVNCVKGTKGASLFPEIREIADYITTKGLDADKGGFSAFESKTLRPLVDLEDILKDEKVTDVTVGGFLLEWCVSHSAFDANSLGFQTTVKLSATGTLQDEFGFQETAAKLEKAGIIVCQ